MAFLHIALPFLRQTPTPHKNLPITPLCFNPGLSEASLPDTGAGWYTPEMPFTPKQVHAILKDMKILLNQDSQYFLHSLNPVEAAGKMAEKEEMAGLADFTSGTFCKAKTTRRENLLKKAQLFLLWRWALEELEEEIAILEKRLWNQERDLQSILKSENKLDEQIEFQVIKKEAPWQQVLQNVAFFLPVDTVIWSEAAMEEEISQLLDFAPANAFDAKCPLDSCDAVLCGQSSVDNLLKLDTGAAQDENSRLSTSYWWVIRNGNQD